MVPNRSRWASARPVRLTVAFVAALGLLAADSAQTIEDEPLIPEEGRGRADAAPPFVLRRLPTESIRTYEGEDLDVQAFEYWKPICGGAPGAQAAASIELSIAGHDAAMEGGGIIIDSSQSLGGLDVVFTVGGTVPAGAVPAIEAAEQYLESLFSNEATIRVSLSFQPLSAGVLGSAGSSLMVVPYATARSGLVGRRDGNDTIQPRLPTGNTLKVRFNGATTAVTNETRVVFPRANLKAAVADSAGSDASITFSTVFPFDYNPADGVTGFSFRDVLVHEVGHAMGFVSAADFIAGDMTAMDLFRFQTSDGPGASDFNPDSLAEFTARPRLVSKNKPEDAHHLELGTVEYRMSDGAPYQASHLREQEPSLGLMDPALGSGFTRHPFYFGTRDLAILDAIGWNR